MRLLIFSDLHGNLPALEQVLANEPVDGHINLGDTVNYGPWGNECVELIAGLNNCICLRGNHEQYFLDGVCNCRNEITRDFFTRCYKDFRHLEVLRNYHESYRIDGVLFQHTLDGMYVFEDSEVSVNRDTVVGHSHRQFLCEVDGFILANPGSLGQNRKYINVGNYIIWENGEFKLKQQMIDIDIMLDEMKSQNYPPQCIEYYSTKPRV